MNCKYEGISLRTAVGLLCLTGVLTACEDDFGKNYGPQSGPLNIKVTVPEGWTTGTTVDESASGSRCVSVDAASSDCSTPLYLHTIESDNAVAAPESRGALKESVEQFSMSAICYTGDYNESWTPNFAYDITCKVNGKDATCPEYLQWPAEGRVRFFAFAPVGDNGDKQFTLSGSTAEGTPKIKYTVPDKTTDQLDLMAACIDATSAEVSLDFRHILTAVKINTAKDMIPGTITNVTLSGIPSTGTYTPDPTATNDKWVVESSTKDYSVVLDVDIDGGYKDPDGSGNLAGTDGSKELIGETKEFTFLMIPQTLPGGATLKITFKEALSGAVYTLTADLEGKTWPAGKKVTYSISPSSIHITPKVEFNKVQETNGNGTISGDILPYSGVWAGVKIKAYAEVTRQGEVDVKYVELPIPTVKYSYTGGTSETAKFYDSDGNEVAAAAAESSTTYTDPKDIASHEGMLVFQPQKSFSTLQGKFGTAVNEFETNTVDLFAIKNESANTYMVGKPGYYKFPVVYGNSCKGSLSTGSNSSAYTIKQTTTTPGMVHYVDYLGNAITSGNYKPASASDAVLAWQDSPDLIDDVKLSKDGDIYWVTFRVSKHTINQGNALIVVRDKSKEIIWSWQIWVTQHTDTWMKWQKSNCSCLKSIYKNDTDYTKLSGLKFTGYEYYLTDCNLGYCDPHPETDAERKFTISFEVKVNNSTISLTTYQNAGTEYITFGKEFLQAEFKGSRAGDNTYYQWGRKDPMLGGIYNSSTPVYHFGTDYSELSMENKPVFNVYEEEINGVSVSYDFTRNNAGTSKTDFGEEKGVDIMWTIKYPYKFVMSKYDDRVSTGMPNYRDHWHKFFDDTYYPTYANGATAELFQMWNTTATDHTDDSKATTDKVGTMKKEDNEYPITKSVYDPCPAGYHVPPAAAFTALAYYSEYYRDSRYNNVTVDDTSYSSSVTWDKSTYTWTVTYTGGSISFPATGVRNKSPRYGTFVDITYDANSSRADFTDTDKYSLGDLTLPAFRMLTYISGASLGKAKTNMDVFYIDKRLVGTSGQDKTITSLDVPNSGPVTPAIGSIRPSAVSYGLSVRPALDIKEETEKP